MRITSFSTHFSGVSAWAAVVAPLQGLLTLFVPQQAASANAALLPRHPAQQPRTSRLKIVRQFEPGVGPACAGRMVISGRMADVCAELDRMAEREGLAARV